MFDYLPEQTLALHLAPLEASCADFLQQVEVRHESLRYDIERPILDPSELYLSAEELLASSLRLQK